MGDLGPLAAALAKAQTQFPPIKRDKKVTVTPKNSAPYSFNYAPLDTILDAVRGPLATNGLAVAQILDDGDLITMLLHDSGAVLSGRIILPAADNIQGLGSAITYLRRYALQAVLGIAAEEDDDGNHAIGGSIAPRSAPREPQRTVRATAAAQSDGPWEGAVSKGRAPVDQNLRESADGATFGFVVSEQVAGSQYPRKTQVLVHGDLAHALATVWATGVPESAMVWGSVEMVPWQKDGADMKPFRRVHATRVMTPEWTLPATDPVAPVSVAPGAAQANDLDGLEW